MAPTTPQHEVIEISDSPTAHPEVIEISDDEVSELLSYRRESAVHPIRFFQSIHLGPERLSDHLLAKQINIPIQPACEPKGDDNPEPIKSELADIKSSGDCPMVSLGPVTSFQSLSSGEFNLGGGTWYMVYIYCLYLYFRSVTILIFLC